jgi:23S rRNA (cytidine1920-2'-O)/16S rRNA (cytidine1409-2'-O)-methyltransferase
MSHLRADVLLVERRLFESRAKARAAIEAGLVSANGVIVARPSHLLPDDAVIAAEPAHRWVGRGGLKLDHALTLWPAPVSGAIVLDVGASTGGFTQVCLERGAAKIYAVDVGKGQLHQSLASDPRVINLEGVDARALTRLEIPARPTLLVCDASFISLAKVLPAAMALAAPDAHMIALVKPQFEVGPANVGKGGVVRDEAARTASVEAVAGWVQTQGWSVIETAESPVRGGEGAVEYLLWAQRGPSAPLSDD